jgi:hypothetical protein
VKLRIKIGRQKSPEPMPDSIALRKAIQAKAEAAERLAATEERAAKEDKQIIQPLKRHYREMMAHNHVAEDLRRLLQDGGK